MVTIKDKSDEIWGWLDIAAPHDQIRYEDGTTKPLTPEDVLFTHGKHEGKLLSDLSDFRYLTWMHQQGVDNQDYFLAKSAKLRLLQLS